MWDTKLIQAQNLSYTEYASWLGRQISPEETVGWWQPNPLVWVAESAAIRDAIYPASGFDKPGLGYEYQYEHLSTAEERLQQGGVRLAAYLDWLFEKS